MKLPTLRTLRAAIAWLTALSLAIACAAKVLPPDGQLMVVLNTDMAPPKDFDLVHIEAKRQGSSTTFYSNDFFFFGTKATRVPSTINFVGGSDRTPIEIRVEARKGEKTRVVRDIRVIIPTERVAQLDVALSYLCDAKTCDAGKTCIFGSCEDPNVDSARLPDFDRDSALGGGSNGTCFDTLECFAKGSPSPVDSTNDGCSIPKPSETGGVNIGVLLPAGTDGICATNACIVPLDQHPGGALIGPLLGWRDEGARLGLPREICNRKLPVVTTTACAPKTPRVPTCGPWSSVGNGKPLGGALPFDPDASAPCLEGTRDCANDNRTPRLCAKGVFQNQAPCAEACNAGSCADCTDGTKSCGSFTGDGGAPLPRSCVGGTWQPLAPCGGNLQCGAGVCADRTWTAWAMPGQGASADGGTPRIPDSNYVVDGEIVTDKTTNLQWLRDFLPSAAATSEAGAISYCATRATRGGGWRLPTTIELLSLVDYGVDDSPYINTNVFPGLVGVTNPFSFRTSTHEPDLATTYTYDVSFVNGLIYLSGPDATSLVRCVR